MDFIQNLETATEQLEYYFQEGVHFKQEDIDKAKQLIKQMQDILDDPFLNISN